MLKPKDNLGRFVQTGKMVLCTKCKKAVYKRGSVIAAHKTFFCSARCQQSHKPSIERLKKLRIGLVSPNKGKKLDYLTNERHHGWKGDKVGYMGLHKWIGRHFGKPKKCEHCGTIAAKKFEWANRTGNYQRGREDWLRLCTRCHRRYDYTKITNRV